MSWCVFCVSVCVFRLNHGPTQCQFRGLAGSDSGDQSEYSGAQTSRGAAQTVGDATGLLLRTAGKIDPPPELMPRPQPYSPSRRPTYHSAHVFTCLIAPPTSSVVLQVLSHPYLSYSSAQTFTCPIALPASSFVLLFPHSHLSYCSSDILICSIAPSTSSLVLQLNPHHH